MLTPLPLERIHPSEPTDEQLASLFESLVTEWLTETALSSSTTAIVTHSAYQRIIGLGPRVVPLLLDKVAKGEPHFGWALAAITGENPAEEAASKSEAARAWLQWGKERGFWQGGTVQTVRRGELSSAEGNG